MEQKLFIPVCRPLLPVVEALKPYLEQIDANRYYSNTGPLTIAFEEKLAEHFGVARENIITSANGTLALVQMLKAYDVTPASLCVMPSWTFTATPAAAFMAGLQPYFIDVDPHTWAIHPNDVLALLAQGHQIGAVLPVSPFGAPLAMAEWEAFHSSTRVPVIIDAAAGFDSFRGSLYEQKPTLPFMVSLHATKVLGIGEGAVVVAQDACLAKKIRLHGNFGFYGSRESCLPGTNAKISEYAAAIGLAALGEWPEKRKAWQQLSTQFAQYVKQNDHLTTVPSFNQSWVSSYGLICLHSPFSAHQIKQQLAHFQIETISWWGKGCHRQAAWKDSPRNALPVTERLSQQVLGMPFWLGLDESNLDHIFSRLTRVLSSEKNRLLVDENDHASLYRYKNGF